MKIFNIEPRKSNYVFVQKWEIEKKVKKNYEILLK